MSLLMFNSSAIILRAHRLSRDNISRTFAIVSTFRGFEGRPLRGSFTRSSQSSLNRLNNSDTTKKTVYEREHCQDKPALSAGKFL
jgi:hypothetical protein